MTDTSTGITPASVVLALWNDIEPQRSVEYERWHTLEHVPERVWVPGFRSGTRYEWLSGEGARYFTLYEIDSAAPLGSADYDALVQEPTPWSASMRPSFRNFLRRIYTLDAGVGVGVGVALMVVRAVWDTQHAVAPSQATFDAFAGALLRNGALCCAMHVRIGLATEAGPQALANVDDAPPGMERLFMLHTTNTSHLDQLKRVFDETLAALPVPPRWQRQATYRLASRVLHAEVTQPSRPAPRLDLMP